AWTSRVHATSSAGRLRCSCGTGCARSWRGCKEESALYSSFMALNIKDSEADKLARELSAQTGESITRAVTVAIRERLERLRGSVPSEGRTRELKRIATRSSRRPVRDDRSPDEILGYD